MEKIYQYVPEEFVQFLLVTLFALLIGLSQRRINLRREGESTSFGTDRTFTFIGILGYLLYIMGSGSMVPFLCGGAVLGVLLAINYFIKQAYHKEFGLTTIIIALITYCIAPIVCTQPSWLYITVVVTVLLFAEMKHTFTEIAQKMHNNEMIVAAKFLAISGIILPMLPHTNIIEGVNLTPYGIWFATVIVSGISYLSYILQRYVFKSSGIMVSGILGGLYSSTATITVLAGKCKKAPATEMGEYVAAMLMSVSMMFLRFLLFMLIFSQAVFAAICPYLLAMAVLTLLVGLLIHAKWKRGNAKMLEEEDGTTNPLEFKVALIFAALFVVFTLLTHYTFHYAGNAGLNILSFVSGFSDITPFILNLVDNTDLANRIVVQCTLQAMASNILINMCYAYFFSGRRKLLRRKLFSAFGIVIALMLGALAIAYMAG